MNIVTDNMCGIIIDAITTQSKRGQHNAVKQLSKLLVKVVDQPDTWHELGMARELEKYFNTSSPAYELDEYNHDMYLVQLELNELTAQNNLANHARIGSLFKRRDDLNKIINNLEKVIKESNSK